MSTLVLDAAGATVAIALVAPGRPTVSRRRTAARGDVLPELCRECLEEAGIEAEAVVSVACGVGPGSFTGLRIALAFAHGFAFRRTLPLAGFSSLALPLAHPRWLEPEHLARPRAVVADALRGEAWVRLEPAGTRPSGDPAQDRRVRLEELSDLLLPDTLVLAEGRPEFLASLPGEAVPTSGSIDGLALAGATTFASFPAEPNYLRLSTPEELRASGRG